MPRKSNAETDSEPLQAKISFFVNQRKNKKEIDFFHHNDRKSFPFKIVRGERKKKSLHFHINFVKAKAKVLCNEYFSYNTLRKVKDVFCCRKKACRVILFMNCLFGVVGVDLVIDGAHECLWLIIK